MSDEPKTWEEAERDAIDTEVAKCIRELFQRLATSLCTATSKASVMASVGTFKANIILVRMARSIAFDVLDELKSEGIAAYIDDWKPANG